MWPDESVLIPADSKSQHRFYGKKAVATDFIKGRILAPTPNISLECTKIFVL
jgi:hypothetical protein